MSNRRDFLKQTLAPAGALCIGILPETTTTADKEPSPLSQKLKSLTRSTSWQLVDQIKVNFMTFHCQGMVKIGNEFWVSSVDIQEKKGHLFQIDAKGNLLADIPVGEGAIYHPGGIDFDGKHIWIAAAEYRPDSNSIIYYFDPATKKLTESFRWQDHIGGILRNPDTNTLHGITWGSRRMYEWDTDKKTHSMILNPAHYIDFQDNQYLGNNEILFTGLSAFKKPDGARFVLGGFEIHDCKMHLPLHQVPLNLWSPATGAIISQNPSWFELAGEKVRAHFMPDDNDSTIFIYEA
jgi:hypothetical protein